MLRAAGCCLINLLCMVSLVYSSFPAFKHQTSTHDNESGFLKPKTNSTVITADPTDKHSLMVAELFEVEGLPSGDLIQAILTKNEPDYPTVTFLQVTVTEDTYLIWTEATADKRLMLIISGFESVPTNKLLEFHDLCVFVKTNPATQDIGDKYSSEYCLSLKVRILDRNLQINDPSKLIENLVEGRTISKPAFLESTALAELGEEFLHPIWTRLMTCVPSTTDIFDRSAEQTQKPPELISTDLVNPTFIYHTGLTEGMELIIRGDYALEYHKHKKFLKLRSNFQSELRLLKSVRLEEPCSELLSVSPYPDRILAVCVTNESLKVHMFDIYPNVTLFPKGGSQSEEDSPKRTLVLTDSYSRKGSFDSCIISEQRPYESSKQEATNFYLLVCLSSEGMVGQFGLFHEPLYLEQLNAPMGMESLKKQYLRLLNVSLSTTVKLFRVDGLFRTKSSDPHIFGMRCTVQIETSDSSLGRPRIAVLGASFLSGEVQLHHAKHIDIPPEEDIASVKICDTSKGIFYFLPQSNRVNFVSSVVNTTLLTSSQLDGSQITGSVCEQEADLFLVKVSLPTNSTSFRPYRLISFRATNQQNSASWVTSIFHGNQAELPLQVITYFDQQKQELHSYEVYFWTNPLANNPFLIRQRVLSLGGNTALTIKTHDPGNFDCQLRYESLIRDAQVLSFSIKVHSLQGLTVNSRVPTGSVQVALRRLDKSNHVVDLEELYELRGSLLDSSMRIQDHDLRDSEYFTFSPRTKPSLYFEDDLGKSDFEHVCLLSSTHMMTVRGTTLTRITRQVTGNNTNTFFENLPSTNKLTVSVSNILQQINLQTIPFSSFLSVAFHRFTLKNGSSTREIFIMAGISNSFAPSTALIGAAQVSMLFVKIFDLELMEERADMNVSIIVNTSCETDSTYQTQITSGTDSLDVGNQTELNFTVGLHLACKLRQGTTLHQIGIENFRWKHQDTEIFNTAYSPTRYKFYQLLTNSPGESGVQNFVLLSTTLTAADAGSHYFVAFVLDSVCLRLQLYTRFVQDEMPPVLLRESRLWLNDVLLKIVTFNCSLLWKACILCTDTNILIQVPLEYNQQTGWSFGPSDFKHLVTKSLENQVPSKYGVKRLIIHENILLVVSKGKDSDTLVYRKEKGLKNVYSTIKQSYKLSADPSLSTMSIDGRRKELIIHAQGPSMGIMHELSTLQMVIRTRDPTILAKISTGVKLELNPSVNLSESKVGTPHLLSLPLQFRLEPIDIVASTRGTVYPFVSVVLALSLLLCSMLLLRVWYKTRVETLRHFPQMELAVRL